VGDSSTTDEAAASFDPTQLDLCHRTGDFAAAVAGEAIALLPLFSYFDELDGREFPERLPGVVFPTRTSATFNLA
jgi:hypothetical protein